MSQAAYAKKVNVSADDGVTWLPLPATSPSLEIGGDVIDDTNLATNAGSRTRIYGLHDWSVSADSVWQASVASAVPDAASGYTGLIACRDAKLNRTNLLIQYLPTGSATDGTGLTGEVLVETFGMGGDVGGSESVSISLQATGAIAAIAAV